MIIDELFTKDLAETTTEMKVVDALGDDTGATMSVCTLQSAGFQKAMLNATDILESSEALAVLIKGWSFETEFSHANAVKLLDNASYLKIKVFNEANAHTTRVFQAKKPLSKAKKSAPSSTPKLAKVE